MAARDLTMHPTTNQQWTRVDLVGDIPEGKTVDMVMEEHGWQRWIPVGTIGSFRIQTWRRQEDGIWKYAVAAGNWMGYSEVVVVPDIVSLLNPLAPWAQMAQASSLCDVVDDLNEGSIDPETGIVETIAARAEWGRTEGLYQLRTELDAEDDDDDEPAIVGQRNAQQDTAMHE